MSSPDTLTVWREGMMNSGVRDELNYSYMYSKKVWLVDLYRVLVTCSGGPGELDFASWNLSSWVSN